MAIRIGAGDGSRTRDLQFGKLMLYQLSYTRTTQMILGSSGAYGNVPGRGHGDQQA
jgi:hypothetical protein